MRIAYIILAHDHPVFLKRLIKKLLSQGAMIVLHLDSKVGNQILKEIVDAFRESADQFHAFSDVKADWGKWSLVEAELRALRVIAEKDWKPDYVHLMSGSEYPIKSVGKFGDFLKNNQDTDFIECVDVRKRRWVQGGLEIERFFYHYPFSYRHPTLRFHLFYCLQKRLGLKRKLPQELKPMMGSQWWTLRWSSCELVLDFICSNPEVVRYFRTTLIPDESFFQTLLSHLLPKGQISNVQVIFHMLCPHTRPFTFMAGHEEIVRALPHFFIRKINPSATSFLDWIDSLDSRHINAQTPTLGQLRQVALTTRKRIARRFAYDSQTAWNDANSRAIPPSISAVLILVHPDEKAYQEFCDLFTPNSHSTWLGRLFAKEISAPHLEEPPVFQTSTESFKRQLFWNTVLAHQGPEQILISYVLGQDRVHEMMFEQNQTQIGAVLLADPSQTVLEKALTNRLLHAEQSSLIRSAVPVNTDEFYEEISQATDEPIQPSR